MKRAAIDRLEKFGCIYPWPLYPYSDNCLRNKAVAIFDDLPMVMGGTVVELGRIWPNGHGYGPETSKRDGDYVKHEKLIVSGYVYIRPARVLPNIFSQAARVSIVWDRLADDNPDTIGEVPDYSKIFDWELVDGGNLGTNDTLARVSNIQNDGRFVVLGTKFIQLGRPIETQEDPMKVPRDNMDTIDLNGFQAQGTSIDFDIDLRGAVSRYEPALGGVTYSSFPTQGRIYLAFSINLDTNFASDSTWKIQFASFLYFNDKS